MQLEPSPEALKILRSSDAGIEAADLTGTANSDDALPSFPDIAWRSIFGDYRDAMVGTTEASDVFHFAALWSAVAVRLGRRVYVNAGDRVYPNIYLALFGATGDKKTTAMRRPRAAGLLDGVQVVSNLGSTEGLADALKQGGGDEAVAMFFWEELTPLLARGRWNGSTILEFLTECFDCPPDWGLRYRRDPITVTAPTPTVIAGTTPDWFWKNARSDDFYGGFGNRFLYLTGAKKPPLPSPIEPDSAKLARVQVALDALGSAPTQKAQFSPPACKLWDEFYIQFEGQNRTGLLGAATRRIHVYVRKLAMTYAAVERTLPEITFDQLKAAMAVGLYGAECIRILIDSQTLSSHPEAEIEQRFIEWVKRNSGERKRYMQQTLSKCAGSCEVFNRVVTNLVRADVIEIQEGRVYYLPVTR
jgi:hypothetical protein